MFGFYVCLCVFHFTACKFDFYVLILQEIQFVQSSCSRYGSVHDTKNCLKHGAMDDTVIANCVKTASTEFSAIYIYFLQIYSV
jgi:hypothetical protein